MSDVPNLPQGPRQQFRMLGTSVYEDGYEYEWATAWHARYNGPPKKLQHITYKDLRIEMRHIYATDPVVIHHLPDNEDN